MPRRSPRNKQSSSLPNYPKEKNVAEKSSWEMMFDELYAFKAQNGHCNVSQSDAGNKSLSHWVNNQRFLYKKNTLSSDHTEQLNSIGFVWDKRDHAWNEKFDQLCAFKAQNGHCNVSQSDAENKILGQWVSTQRVFYKKNAMSPDRIKQMNSIGFIWNLNEKYIAERMSWQQRFNELCAFRAQNGHCNVSTLDARNKSLGGWVHTQRVSYKKNALNSDRIQQLDSIGFIWYLKGDGRPRSWRDQFDELSEYKAKNGHCIVSKNYARHKSLSRWVKAQRMLYKKNTLSSDRIEQLNSIGFAWDENEYVWKDKFDELCAFKAQNGHCNVSQSKYDTTGNETLGRWVSTQRMSYNRNTLSSTRVEQLNSIGFIWGRLEYTWNENFDQLCAFKAQNGHCNVSQHDARNKPLGLWVKAQRASYKKNALNSNQMQQLNSIGFKWDAPVPSWNDHFDQLCAFKAQNGHCNVSQSRYDTGNKTLRRWVSTQRVSYKKNALSSNQIQQLNSIGFVWDPRE
eukprot:15365520-Ditylum_brightwellii.AAC.1